MAFLHFKLNFGGGTGIVLSEQGVSPFLKTEACTLSSAMTSIPTPVPGIKVSFGSNSGGSIVLGLAKALARSQEQKDRAQPAQKPAKRKPRDGSSA